MKLSFNKLNGNFEGNILEFKHYSEKVDPKLIIFLDKIRHVGNESIHTIEDSITLNKLEDIKEDVNFYVKVSLNINTLLRPCF